VLLSEVSRKVLQDPLVTHQFECLYSSIWIPEYFEVYHYRQVRMKWTKESSAFSSVWVRVLDAGGARF
jgi:hypothetical protein